MRRSCEEDHAAVTEAVRERLSLLELCLTLGMEVRRSGRAAVMRCPFHGEKTASFSIGGRGRDRGCCFGCGWKGDIFAFYAEVKGCDFAGARQALAELVGLGSAASELTWAARRRELAARKLPGLTRGERESQVPTLPRMRRLREPEMAQLAASRGLSVAGVRAADALGRLGYSLWPLWERRKGDGYGRPCVAHWWSCDGSGPDCCPREVWPSWCVTDSARRVAEYRRLDGELYPKSDGTGIKAWSTAGKNWPVGCVDIGDRQCVVLVEGGPDILAAYHFLSGLGLLDRVAVVGMLGAGAGIAEETLGFFRGRRVLLCPDVDAERVVELGGGRTRRTRPGYEAGLRWQKTLTGAGAAVACLNLEGLVQADGRPVKDLNDAARMAGPAWSEPGGRAVLKGLSSWGW